MIEPSSSTPLLSSSPSTSKSNFAPSPDNTPSFLTLTIVLLTICLLNFNNFFCYHSPSAIASEFQSEYHLSSTQFGTLFTVYSLPNIILVFLSGVMIDQHGVRRMSLIFNFIILVGMLICALTPTLPHLSSSSSSSSSSFNFSYGSLLLGRFLLGVGGESICACASTMITMWFPPSHINTAMSINQAVVQLLGSSLAFYLLPLMGEGNIHKVQWITFTVAAISMIMTIVYGIMEIKWGKFIVLKMKMEGKDDMEEREWKENQNYDNYSEKNQNDNTNNPYTKSVAKDNNDNAISLNPSLPSSALSFSHLLLTLSSLPFSFYLLLLHISLMSPILYTFTAFGPLYLQENFPLTASPISASYATSLLYATIVLSPMWGMAIDRLGYRVIIQCGCCMFIPVGMILLHLEYVTPNMGMVLLGISFSVSESNSLAMLSLSVPPPLIGSAFGLVGCAISIALLIEPAAVGFIRETTGSYKMTIWIFVGVTVVGTMVGVWLWGNDWREGGKLSKSAKEIKGDRKRRKESESDYGG